MDATKERFEEWLFSLPDKFDHDPLTSSTESNEGEGHGRQHKRQKCSDNRQGLPSPAPSNLPRTIASMDSSSLKRHRQDPDEPAPSDEAHDEITPRPGRFQNHPTSERTPSSASSASGHSISRFKCRNSMSSRSSSQQIRNAEIKQTGFRMGSFILDTYPESLHNLRDDLYNIGVGHGILPASLKNKAPSKRKFQNTAIRIRRNRSHPSADRIHRDRPAVNRLGCVERGNPRHAKIFEQAFRKSNGFVSDGPVDFRYSQAAQIIRDYKPREAPSKMVDFCVIYKPERGSPVERAIEEICQTRPAQSINHTDLGDLCKRPIVLSIETKRPNIDRDNATLQMGTWQSAQWRSLQHKRSPSFRPIDFLPGIIVQGHDWQFVASILDENDKPVLLKGVQLGGTDSELRIYSLILGLRRLKRWIMEDYWPAFVSDVLAIS
ncbi:hypothetical protein IWW34DRAFT_859706 [Fusarium oxysporum f. sp. albedinis]|nr:hypothetical protein IWW34DRAFT_859706 [Fusarium oxysporum f. sp. albedinis]